jgi:hypothetical protein
MKCLTCKHYKPGQSGEMAKVGFAICAQQPRYTFNAPSHSCPKHQPAKPAAVEARRTWAA